MSVSIPFITTFCLTIAGMIAVAAVSSCKVRSADDFSLAGRRAGTYHVAGSILGTMIGGASTIGTVQLAFLYGLSAWWFTLGCGVACLFMALALAPALRDGQVETVAQFISRYHGERARVCASIFSAAGMFLHIVAQLMAAGALLATIFDISFFWGALAALCLTALFTVGGGMASAGPLGMIKMFLIGITMLAGGLLAFSLVGGIAGFQSALPPFPWFSPFGYGVGNGLSDFCSLLVGVISTQTYLQAIFSSRDIKAARNGTLICAAVMPPIGLLGISIGLYMRISSPGIESAQTLPLFLTQHFHPALTGIAYAALLITAIGTAAGLAVGVSTTVMIDIINRLKSSRQNSLALLRILTFFTLAAAFCILAAQINSAIMKWSYVSMGLRGATICIPLLLAIFLGKRTTSTGGALSIFLAPLAVLIAGFLSSPIPPLYVGLLVSIACIAYGFIAKPCAGR